jgi:hypothetical protein
MADDKRIKDVIDKANLSAEDLEIAKKIHTEMSSMADLTANELRIMQLIYGERLKNLQSLKNEKETLAAILEIEKARTGGLRDHSQILATNKELRNADIALRQSAIRDQEKLIALLRTKGNNEKENLAKAREQLTVLQRQLQLMKGQSNAHDSIERGAKGVLKTTLGISNAWEGTASGGMAKAVASGDSFKNVMGTLGGTVKATIVSWQGLANVAFSTLQKMQEMTMRNVKVMDTLNAAYARSTGLVTQNNQATGMLTNELQEGFFATTKLYASMEELNSARTALATSSSRYVDMSTRERQALDGLGIMLEKAGYGVQMLAQHFDTYTIGLGMTVPQTQAFQREVIGMSQQIGITSSQLSRDFPAALKVAIQYTGQETRVLRGLMEQAKATGLEMSKLTGIVAQYDTFEGAGEAVGRLNAILGGPYLNAIQMVYATEDQRLQILRQSVAASGQQFATLEKYEQKAIMAAAGINDINTALQMFGGGGAAFDRQIRQQKELEELARKATPVFQQITASLQRLALAGKPFVTMLEVISEGLMHVMPTSVQGTVVAFGLLMTAAGLATFKLGGMSHAFLKSKVEALSVNSALNSQNRILTQLATKWRIVGDRAVAAMHKMTAASNSMSAAAGGAGPGQRGVPTGTARPIPPGGGGAPPAGPGAGRAAGYAAIAGGIAMYLGPKISAHMAKDTAAQRKTAAGVQGMLQWGGTMAMLLPTIAAIAGAPLTGGASLALLAGAGAVGAGAGAISTHHGGLNSGPVPGPRGRETTIRAQGGEFVVQPEQLAALARGSSDPKLGQNVDALNKTVNSLGAQLSNFEQTVNQLMGAHTGKKSDMFVTVNMDSKQVTEQVITNLETNPNYGLALG